MVSLTNINKQLNKFWEIEEVNFEQKDPCENMYSCTVQKLKRKIYSENANKKIEELGASINRAVARLYQIERKLQSNFQLKKDYNSFMNEYINLKHMKETASSDDGYFIPHHAVLKDSTTTKLRVVFDASAKTTNNKSLNDVMLIGPKLQQDLALIITKWRFHKIVFCADIEKMFRQILIDESQHKYQKILWRSSQDQKIKEYELQTVTYGTAAAPFLAIRTLQQLALDYKTELPTASKICLSDFYVDYLLFGCSYAQLLKEPKKKLQKSSNLWKRENLL
jgi:hypothetical protein